MEKKKERRNDRETQKWRKEVGRKLQEEEDKDVTGEREVERRKDRKKDRAPGRRRN